MSRRIATDTGGRRGPQSSRPARREDYDDRPASRDNANGGGMGNNSNNNMPPMNFPFPGMPNGMMFPPGFFQNFQQQQGGGGN
jgi:protein NRD1